MESSSGIYKGLDMSENGEIRGSRVRTRAQVRAAKAKQAERDAAIGGLSQQEFWSRHVKSE